MFCYRKKGRGSWEKIELPPLANFANKIKCTSCLWGSKRTLNYVKDDCDSDVKRVFFYDSYSRLKTDVKNHSFGQFQEEKKKKISWRCEDKRQLGERLQEGILGLLRGSILTERLGQLEEKHKVYYEEHKTIRTNKTGLKYQSAMAISAEPRRILFIEKMRLSTELARLL